ncbi:ester cyclase [Spirosoma gilvum]
MRNTTTTLLHKWFQDVWNNDDETAIDRLMTSDAFAQGVFTEDHPRGAEGFKLFFRDFRSQFHTIKVDIDDVISQDDVESARTTVHAIHTASDKPVTFPGICMVRVEDGKIAEAWNSYDFLSMYQQIGMQLTPVE